jgi:O-antigen ligase
MLQAKGFKIALMVLGALALALAASFSASITFLAVISLVLLAFFYFYSETAFYFLVAYLPFQIALNLTSDIDLISGRLLILLLFFVIILKSLKGEKIIWSKNRIAVALILFFLITLISILIASNQLWGLRKVLVFLSIFPLFFLTQNFITSGKKLKRLLWIIVGVTTVSVLIAFIQFISQFIFGYEAVFNFWSKNIAPFFFGQSFGQTVLQNPSWCVNVGGRTLMRAIGLFPDPHMLAFFIGLMSPLVLVLFFGEKRHRRLLLLVYCFMLIILFLTFSRGGYLGLLGSILAMGLVSWKKFSPKTRIFISSLFLVLAVVIVLTPVWVRFSSSFNLTEGSNVGRLKIWTEALTQFEKTPLLGVGLGNYPLALDFNAIYRSAVTSHNLYLDILVETGIFGLLAWLWFLGGMLKKLLTEIKGDLTRLSIIAMGLLGAIVYFCIHSFFETPIFNPTILAFLMIVSALAASISNILDKKP